MCVKRYICFCIALLLVVCCSACSNNDKTDPTETTTPTVGDSTQPTSPTINIPTEPAYKPMFNWEEKEEVSFPDIPELVFDPATGYISTPFTLDVEQIYQALVNEVFAEVQKKYDEPIAVEKCPLDCFYTGEEYHQQYLIKNPDGYCHLSPSLLRSAKTYAQITRELRQCSDENEVRKVMEKFNEAPSEVLEWLKESECDKVRLFAHILSGENTLS